MAAEVRYIGEDAKSVAQPKLSVNTGGNRYLDDLFHPSRIVLKLTVNLGTAVGSGVTVEAKTFLRNCLLNVRYADGCAMVENLPLFYLDYAMSLLQDALAVAPLAAVDKTIAQNTAGQEIVYLIPLIITPPFAAAPEDYEIAISEIGDIELQIGAIGTAGTMVNSCHLEVIGIGRTRRHQRLGLRQFFDRRQVSGQTSDAYNLGGRALISQSIGADAASGLPTAILGLTLKADSRLVVDGAKLAGIDQLAILGLDPFYNPSAVPPTYAGFAPVYLAPWRNKLSELIRAQTLNLDYRTQSVANGAGSIVVHSVYPQGRNLANRIGAAAGVDPAQVPELIVRDRLDTSKPATSAMLPWLPRIWKGPVRSTSGGGCNG